MAQRTSARTPTTPTPAGGARKGSGRPSGTTTPARSRLADRGGAGRPEPRPPARVRARRWFAGLDPWRRVLLALAALAVVAVVVALVVVLTREAPAATDEGLAVDPARMALACDLIGAPADAVRWRIIPARPDGGHVLRCTWNGDDSEAIIPVGVSNG